MVVTAQTCSSPLPATLAAAWLIWPMSPAWASTSPNYTHDPDVSVRRIVCHNLPAMLISHTCVTVISRFLL